MKSTFVRLALALLGLVAITPRSAYAAQVIGAALQEVLDWSAPDGKVYDTVRMTGAAATVSADAGQIVRVRFLDFHGDLVNADFWGAGQLTVSLDSATGPTSATLYNLPGVQFMQGGATLTIIGGDATSGLQVFASGPATDPSISIGGSDYEGLADLVKLQIVTVAQPGRFGVIRAAGTRFSAASGVTGVVASGVLIEGDVRVGDIEASGTATPTLTFGGVGAVEICGGDLGQPNASRIRVSGFSPSTALLFGAGVDANGITRPAQPNLGEFLESGATPSISSHPSSAFVAVGADASFSIGAVNAASFQWECNGFAIAGATASGLTITNASPASAGIYQAVAVNGPNATLSRPAILGVTTASKVVGAGSELIMNVAHPAGYVYDQVLPTGPALSVTADPEQVTRLNFIDLDDDIVQVEFRGPGTLSLVLDNASGPASPAKYNQPTVQYMKGHAGIVIAGADERTHLSITSIGRATVFDPSGGFNFLLPISATNDPANNGSPLFSGHASTVYDGFADLAFIAVISSNGQFGGIDAGNVNCFATQGFTGIFAPGVTFTRPVLIGDVLASGAATPVLVCASVADLRVLGGSLAQPNSRMIQTAGFSAPAGIQFLAGMDSHGRTLPAGTNQAEFEASPAPGVAPAITSAEAAMFVVGLPGSFTVQTTGAPTPVLTVASGTLPSWATLGSTGVISGTPPSTAGSPFTFTLQAANAQGAPATQTFTLTVVEPPITVAPLADQTVTAGESVTFSASATGDGELYYQWRHNARPIFGATAATYTISSATMADAGLYDVVVSLSGDKVVSGAAYLSVAPTTYPTMMRIDPTFQPAIESAGGHVYGLVQQSDGKLIVGGEFSRVSGVLRPNLARIHRTGAIDSSFDPGAGPNGLVRRMVLVANGKVVIAGDFTSYGGIPRNRIARINSDGTLDQTFDPGAGPNEQVLALAVQPDGRLLVGGWFSAFAGVSRPRVVRLHSDGSVDTTFSSGTGPAGSVTAFALQPDGKIILAGKFATYSGAARSSVARLNSDGSLDTGFVSAVGADYDARSLARQPDGKVLLGGYNPNNSQPNLLRLNGDGTLDSSFSAGVTQPMLALIVQPDGRIVAGIGAETGSGLPRRGAARFNPDGSADSTFSPGPLLVAEVEALVLEPDGGLVIGSGTQILPAPDAHRILRLTSSGATDPTFGAALRSLATVQQMVRQPDGKLIIAGDFEYVNDVARARIARLTVEGILDGTFDPGTGADNEIAEMLLQPDGRILIAGSFGNVAGQTRKHLARLNSDGSVDVGFDPGAGPDSDVIALARQLDGRILIGGYFAHYQGVARSHVARLEPNGLLDATFQTGTGPNSVVEFLALQRDGRIVIGGPFSTVDGRSRQRLARLNADGSLDATFVPPNTARYVRGIWAQSDSRLLVSFDGYEGLKRLLPTGAVDESFAANHLLSSFWVAGSALQQADGKTLVGLLLHDVTYTGPDGVGLMRLAADGAVDPDFSIPDFRGAKVSDMVLIDDGRIFVAGTRFSDGTVVQGGLARLAQVVAPAFTSDNHGSFVLGSANATTVTASGGPAPRFSVIGGDFPSWAQLNSTTGVISGTPLDVDGSPFTFVIEAENGVGIPATQTFTLTIVSGAISIMPLESKGATAGESITWTASASGETPASYQWRLNGQPIAGATSASYTIPAVTMLDAGRYDVVVTSAGGQTFTSAGGNLEVAPTRYPGAMRLDPTFAPLIEDANGTILSIARQPDGKLVVGGSFSRINGTLRRNLARLNADGSVDASFDPGLGPNQPVFKVLLQTDGKILLGGEFLAYDGESRGRIARVNSDGSLDTSFTVGTGAEDRVEAIALQPDGKIVIGGWFDSVNGATRPRIARLNVDGSVDLTFNAGTAAATMDVLVLSDGRILAAGPFVRFAGASLNGVVRLAADGSIDPSFVPETWSGLDATSLALQADGKIVVGAASFEQNGPDLLRLNSDGSRDASFTPPSIRRIDALALQSDGKIVIGGRLIAGGTLRYQVARLQSNGSLDANFNASGSLDFDVEAIALLASGQLVVGGRGLSRADSTHNGFARLKATGVIDSSLPGELRSPGTVEALVRQRDGKLLIGGSFSYVNGAVRKGLARLEAHGSLDPSFAPAAILVGGVTGASGAVSALVSQPDGKIIVAGFFDRVNGATRRNIARLLGDGSVDPSFDPGLGTNSRIFSVALQPDGRFLLGGLFSTYEGVARNRLARINPNGSLDSTFDPGAGANWPVTTVVLRPDGRVLVCGGFTSFNGVSRLGLACVNSDGSLDSGFGMVDPLVSGAETIVQDSQGNLYVGGWGGITRLTPEGSVDATYASADLSDVGNIGEICRQADGRLIVGQDLSSYSDRAVAGIARVNANGTRDDSFVILGLHSSHFGAIEMLEDGGMLIAGTAFNDGTMEQYGLARLEFVPAPSITQPPTNVTINVGQTLTMSVTVAGDGAFTYQWRKGGVPITGNASAETATLTVANAQVADAGDYDVIVTNLGGSTTSAAAAAVVYQPPQITTQPANRTITAGASITFSVVATGNPAPTYQWHRNGAPLPGATSASLRLDDVPVNGGGEITVVVRNPGGTIESEPATLTVNPVAPVFAGDLPATALAVQGRSFLFPVRVNATPATFTATGLAAAGGTLFINANNGTISGVPANVGTFPVTITVTNAGGTDTHSLSLTVQAPPPVITSAALANAHVDSAFSFAVVATNAPSTYSAIGLPDGLTIDPATGVISGTPAAAGTFTIQLVATNAFGSIAQPFVLTIAPKPNSPVYTGAKSLAGVRGAPFSFTPSFGAVTAPYGLDGSLPQGLSFAATTGVISGTPTETGTFPIRLSATNAVGTTAVDLSIVINPAPTAPVITSASAAPLARIGVPFSFTLTSSGTPPASSYLAVDLPVGLALEAETGVISGTPSEIGIFYPTLAAISSAGQGPQAILAITIVPSADAPVISSAALAPGRVGQPFNYSIAASKAPTSFAVATGTLPAGLTLDSPTGAITGTPDTETVGETRVWFTATNAAGTGFATEVLFQIAPPLTTPVITSNGTAIARVGQPFHYVITTLGGAPVTGCAASGLPGWLSLDAATGVLTGVPPEPTVTPLTLLLTATNATGNSSPKLVLLTVAPAPETPCITSSLTAMGREGVAFNHRVTASGSPTSFAATGLPPGLSLNSASGEITGTPKSSGGFEVVLRASNANGLGAAAMLKLGIAPAASAPAITSAAAAVGQVGADFTYQIVASHEPILSYGLTGTLPLGLAFNSATGTITGKPSDNPRTYTVELTATNATGTSLPQPLLIHIAPAVGVPVLTTPEFAFGRVGESFSLTITATNLSGTAPYAPPILLEAVNLPPGLAVNPATGLIEGVPTQVGTTAATLLAANAAGTSTTRDLTIQIHPAAAAPRIRSDGNASARVGEAFGYQITATNCPNRYEVLEAPEWMHVNTTTGFITGLPEVPGTWTVQLLAANGDGTSSPVPLRVEVAAKAAAPVVTSSRTQTGTVGTSMGFTIVAAPVAPAVTFVASGVPPGLMLDAETGVVSGVPTESGTFEMTVTPASSDGVGAPVTLKIGILPNVIFGS